MSKLTVCSALALFLMVADVRFGVTQPMRALLATILYPAQWLVLQPLIVLRGSAAYLQSHKATQIALERMRISMVQQSQKANQVEQLALENTRLRALLELRQRISTPAQAAQVLYETADPFSRKVVIDKGVVNGVVAGSAVIDESGVLGQVTRVYASVSEVTLLTDQDQAIPVLNTRTGARGVAFGDPSAPRAALELRFASSNADIEPGDLLTTSGVDAVYPPGLPVARVDRVERRAESAFAHVHLIALARIGAAEHVMVLQPVTAQVAPRPEPEPATPLARKAERK